MKYELSNFKMTAMSCLIAIQTFANLAHSGQEPIVGEPKAPQIKVNHTSIRNTDGFELPENIRNSSPNKSLKDIFDLSKSGTLKDRPLGGMYGGGGKILVCEKNGKYEALVLDLFEARKSGFTIDLGPGKTRSEKISYVLNRLAKVAPYHALSYKKWIKELLKSESAFYEDSILPVTDDLGVAVLPNNCEVLQVVVQRNNDESKLPGMFRYLFDKDAFLNLDIDNQVALIFHEVIYREARGRGEQDSLRARYMTNLVLSKNIESFTMDKFNDTLEKIGSKCTEHEEFIIKECEELPFIATEVTLTHEPKSLKDLFEGVITGRILPFQYQESTRNSVKGLYVEGPLNLTDFVWRKFLKYAFESRKNFTNNFELAANGERYFFSYPEGERPISSGSFSMEPISSTLISGFEWSPINYSLKIDKTSISCQKGFLRMDTYFTGLECEKIEYKTDSGRQGTLIGNLKKNKAYQIPLFLKNDGTISFYIYDSFKEEEINLE